MTDLLQSASKNILNLLVLHLSTHKERMLSGVQMLAELEPQGEDQRTRPSNVCLSVQGFSKSLQLQSSLQSIYLQLQYALSL